MKNRKLHSTNKNNSESGFFVFLGASTTEAPYPTGGSGAHYFCQL